MEIKTATKNITDQLNRNITVPVKPKRIISLVPSQTELLFELGLDNEVIGITKFCIHPESWYKIKTKIGGTKNLNFEKIKSLQPDLIIGNKEENDEEQIRILMNEFTVWMSDIISLENAFSMIQSIGEMVNHQTEAAAIKNSIENNFAKLRWTINNNTPSILHKSLKALYLIWYQPLMAAGANTFINSMLMQCGFENAVGHLQRYPVIDKKELININPDLVFLSSEPFPFKQKHTEEIKKILPEAKVIFVDGEYFSWYGSRLIAAPAYFNSLIKSIG